MSSGDIGCDREGRCGALNERYVVTAGRIRQELEELGQTVERAQRAFIGAQTGGVDQDLFLDATALNLHDFYTGIERIFQQIATAVDNSMPTGRDWHRDLLHQMGLTVPQVRPQVLSTQMLGALKEYLGFRHVVRNIYAFQFDPERVRPLVDRLPDLFSKIGNELQTFADFLEQVENT